MQPNELTLEAQMFDAKINSMDKTCLLAPLSFFDACNVSTDEERLRRMMLLRTRALQLGISEQEYADRRDNYKGAYAIWYDTKKVPENIIEQLTWEAARA